MTNTLDADAEGLRAGAASSELVAADLVKGSPAGEGRSGSHPSHTGVQAMDDAMGSLRIRQSHRISGQAADVTVAAAQYDKTDGRAADDIAVTM